MNTGPFCLGIIDENSNVFHNKNKNWRVEIFIAFAHFFIFIGSHDTENSRKSMYSSHMFLFTEPRIETTGKTSGQIYWLAE